jgi:hypothetical protein
VACFVIFTTTPNMANNERPDYSSSVGYPPDSGYECERRQTRRPGPMKKRDGAESAGRINGEALPGAGRLCDRTSPWIRAWTAQPGLRAAGPPRLGSTGLRESDAVPGSNTKAIVAWGKWKGSLGRGAAELPPAPWQRLLVSKFLPCGLRCR